MGAIVIAKAMNLPRHARDKRTESGETGGFCRSKCLKFKADFPDGPPEIFFYGMGPAPDSIMERNGFTGAKSDFLEPVSPQN